MQWKKRVAFYVVITLLILPIVFAQITNFVGQRVADLGIIFDFLVRWHLVDFATYFALFFWILKQSLGQLWKKKNLPLDEREEKLVNGLALVVGVSLALSLVYWSDRNGFTFFDFGWFAGLILLAAFVLGLVITFLYKREGKDAKFPLFTILFILFLGVLAVRFFSPQMFGTDLLSRFSYSDYLVGGILLLIASVIIYNVVLGLRKKEKGGAPSGEGGVFSRLFASEWTKGFGLFFLVVLGLVILFFLRNFIPFAIWIGLIVALAAGWLLWMVFGGETEASGNEPGEGSAGGGRGIFKRILSAPFRLVKWLGKKAIRKVKGWVRGEHVVAEEEERDFSITIHAHPGVRVIQGTQLSLHVVIDGGSHQFAYRWLNQNGQELPMENPREGSLVVNTYVLPEVREASKRPFSIITRVYTVDVRDQKTKVIKRKSVEIIILPPKEPLNYIKILYPARSKETAPFMAGEREIPFGYALKDPFREVRYLRLFLVAKKTLAPEDLISPLYTHQPPQPQRPEEEVTESFSIQKERVGFLRPGTYTLWVRCYDELGAVVPNMEDMVFIEIERPPALQQVTITRVGMKSVTRRMSEQTPIEVELGEKIELEADLMQKRGSVATNVLWTILPNDPAKIAENWDAKAYTLLELGLTPVITLEKNRHEPGKVLLLVAFPTTTAVRQGRTEMGEPIFDGHDYIHIVVRHASAAKVLFVQPDTRDQNKPYTKIKLNEPTKVRFRLDDPNKQVRLVRFSYVTENNDRVIVSEINVIDAMRGGVNAEDIIIFKKPVLGKVPFFVEAIGVDKKTVLYSDECWVALSDGNFSIDIEAVQGAFDFKKIKNKQSKKEEKHAVIDYEENVTFIVVPSKQDLASSYAWAIRNAKRTFKESLGKTHEPKLSFTFSLEKFPSDAYEVVVIALDDNGEWVKDPVKGSWVGDHVFVSFRGINPYILLDGKQVDDKALPVVSVGKEIAFEGKIREQNLQKSIISDWGIKAPDGSLMKEYYKKGNMMKVRFEQAGIYTITFTAYCPLPEMEKGGSAFVQVRALDEQEMAQKKEQKVRGLLMAKNVRTENEMESLLDVCRSANGKIINVLKIAGMKDWQERLQKAGMKKEQILSLTTSLAQLQLQDKDTVTLGVLMQKGALTDTEKEEILAILKRIEVQFVKLQKNPTAVRFADEVLAFAKIRGGLKENVDLGLSLARELLKNNRVLSFFK